MNWGVIVLLLREEVRKETYIPPLLSYLIARHPFTPVVYLCHSFPPFTTYPLLSFLSIPIPLSSSSPPKQFGETVLTGGVAPGDNSSRLTWCWSDLPVTAATDSDSRRECEDGCCVRLTERNLTAVRVVRGFYRLNDRETQRWSEEIYMFEIKQDRAGRWVIQYIEQRWKKVTLEVVVCNYITFHVLFLFIALLFLCYFNYLSNYLLLF